MTLHIVDVSRYQVERTNPLDLAQAKDAGMGAVNIALDRGRSEDVFPEWTRDYAERARKLGMGVSTYRWLDARIPGAESAARAYARIRELGGPDGMAHSVDCEADATWGILRDYVGAMQDMVGRHVAVYTGDWWWRSTGQWPGAELTPYLWAAPNAGYLDGYPGDDSLHWSAVYGGWSVLSLMQYAVQALPGTGRCSLTAVRDNSVWHGLTGGFVDWYLNRALSNFRRAVNAAYPLRDKASDGTIGDAAHAAGMSDHNPDPVGSLTPGSVDAWDMDVELNGAGRPYTVDVEHIKQVFQRHESSRYWIHNGQIASRSTGWRRETYTGTNAHIRHVHWNTRESHENSDAPWIIERTLSMADVSQDEWNTLFFTEVRAPNGPSHVRDGLQLQELQALRREFAEHAGRPAPEMPPVMTNDQVVVLAQKLHELDNGIDVDVDTLTLAIVQALRTIVGASVPVGPEA